MRQVMSWQLATSVVPVSELPAVRPDLPAHLLNEQQDCHVTLWQE